MKKYLVWSVLFAGMFMLSGCNDDDTKTEPRLYALYGDYESTKVFKVDTREMKLQATMDVSPAQGPYGVECDTREEAFALTRAAESIAIINYRTNEVLDIVPLKFKPRSTAHRDNSDVVVVSGKSKPMAVTIGKYDHRVKHYFGIDTDQPVDSDNYFGGGNATGHPFLLADGKRFLLLDRVRRKIFLFDIDNETPLAELDTETTAHHVITLESEHDEKGNGTYYVVLEGPKESNDTSIPAAGIMKFTITADNQMTVDTIFHVAHEHGGTHHARFYGDKYIFLPTFNNKVYVIDKNTMSEVARFDAGKGGGHITFSPQRKIAIVTNHKDKFVTMVNVSDPAHPVVIKNIYVADEFPPDGKNAQAHTSAFDKTGRYFYSVANCEHKFYEIDTEYEWVSRTCFLDGDYIPMGDFVYY
jgi:DNA-binding beta-propeller fold protein YncE